MTDIKWFLLYPNARVIFEGIEQDVTFIDLVDRLIYLHKSGWVKPEECKQGLKPLSSLTEEDKRELAEVLDRNEAELWYDNATIAVRNTYYDHWEEIEVSELPYKAADYLRSKSYDIDNLIQQGIAVEGKI